MILLIFVIFFQISCEKDTDLLLEAILPKDLAEITFDNENATITVEEDRSVSFNMLNNNTSKSTRNRFKSAKQPTNGKLLIEKDSVAIYTPIKDFNGTDSIEITLEAINDDNSTSEVIMNVQANVTPVDDVVDDKFETKTGNSVIIKPLANDKFNADSEVLITEISKASKGNVLINDDNSLTYTPNPGAVGIDLFTYTTALTHIDSTTTTEKGNITITINSDTADSSYINFSVYGAKGDGVTDDTAALQAAFDKESKLVANSGATFKISSTLKFTQASTHNINWNNSKIITSNKLSPVMLVDKRKNNGGSVTMSNLTIDGNYNAVRGIEIFTEIHLTDVDITELKGSIPSPAGLVTKIYNHPSVGSSWTFTRCDITWIKGTDNDKITDATGAANSILSYYEEVPSIDLIINYKDSNINNTWSEDSGLMYVLDNTTNRAIKNSGTKWVIENMDFRDVERRTLKGFGGNIEAYNCTFTDPAPSNTNIGSKKTNSGLVTIGGYNNIFENCTFNRIGDYDGRVIPVDCYELEIKGCTFNGGADLAFTAEIGDVIIENCFFNSGSSIYAYGQTFKGSIKIDSKNTAEPNYIKLNLLDYILF